MGKGREGGEGKEKGEGRGREREGEGEGTSPPIGEESSQLKAGEVRALSPTLSLDHYSASVLIAIAIPFP